jgi:hypothetical protein
MVIGELSPSQVQGGPVPAPRRTGDAQPMTRVLYLAGWGRSGTTIIDNVLGSYPGVFTSGELCFLWQRGLIGKRPCGCGAKVRDCELWREILRAAYGDNPPDPHQVLAWQREAARARHAPRLLRGEHPLGDVMARLYRGIAHVTGAALIVDSSKLPSGAAILARQPDISAYLLHVVRDPRAVAFSWARPTMRKHGLWDSTAKWVSWNLLTELMTRAYPGRSRRVRYEEFAADPRGVITDVLTFAQMSASGGPFTGDRTVDLAMNHTISGNPGRFRTGPVELRADEAWRTEMAGSAKLATTALSWPLMARYGYRVR